MSFVQVFGGTTLYPADVSYLALALTANTTLQWPLEASTGSNLVARIIDVTPSDAFSITMPPANQTAPGQLVMFNNLGPHDVSVLDAAGGGLLAISPGHIWSLYLTSNASAAGTWRTFQYGASTSQAQASALAGAGLVAISSLLAQSQEVATFNADYTAGAGDRSKVYVWTGGLGTLTLTSAGALGNNWFMGVRNGGTGNLIIAPSGADTINGATTLTLHPGDSATVNTDGTLFYTVGLGQDSVFSFDYTSINLAGLSGTYTLSGAELNRIAYQFTGALAGNIEVVVPSTTQQYWVDNDTTGGSFTLGLRTAAQSPAVTVVRGARGIYYSQGSEVVNADTASISSPISIADGGTGATTASAARVNLGGTATGISVFTAASAAAGRAALSAAVSGANGDITSLTGLTTPLSIAQGGTAGTTAAGARGALGAAALGANSDITALSGLTTPLSVAQGGTGVVTLTGIPKAAGTAAFVAATAGTDFAAPFASSTWTTKQTFTGGAAVLAMKLNSALETVTIAATAATGTVNYELLTQSVLYYTTDAAANWVVNIRGDGSHSLDSLMATGESVTLAFGVTQGATPYYNTSVQVDGTTSGVTTKWLGGAPSAGTASSINVYNYTVIKTGSATFTVLASRSAFS